MKNPMINFLRTHANGTRKLINLKYGDYVRMVLSKERILRTMNIAVSGFVKWVPSPIKYEDF